MNLNIRNASFEDLAHIQALISKSARILQAQYYKKSEIEAALELVHGIEELIIAGSFLVAEHERKIIGCGGWAFDVSYPQKAEIRGFFVHPDFVRRGVAALLLNTCENICLRKGIETLYLTATLSGELFYKKYGFFEFERFNQDLSNGQTFELIKMEKVL
ncbi:GNAT family N-acetyltransferase [Methylobacter sp. sgz302048]|uniref:GNAT family N-acetyltransferase n=1 Tax=Methylobacter sp. sgz302048 TaxID=3455945 RepID=UPI003F9F6E66